MIFWISFGICPNRLCASINQYFCQCENCWKIGRSAEWIQLKQKRTFFSLTAVRFYCCGKSGWKNRHKYQHRELTGADCKHHIDRLRSKLPFQMAIGKRNRVHAMWDFLSMTNSIFIAIIYPLYIYIYIFCILFSFFPDRIIYVYVDLQHISTSTTETPTGDDRKFGSMHIYNYFIAVNISLLGILYTIKWHCRLSLCVFRVCVFMMLYGLCTLCLVNVVVSEWEKDDRPALRQYELHRTDFTPKLSE